MDKRLGVNEVRTAFRRITGDGLQLHPFPTELEGVIPRVDYLSFDTIESAPDGTHNLFGTREAARDVRRLRDRRLRVLNAPSSA
jgi:hypothetical protein